MSLPVYLLNFLLLAGLVWWLQRQAWAQELKPYFYPALLLKLLCGVLLGILYFEHYGSGDTITYYNASLKLTAHARESPASYIRLLLLNEFESEAFRAGIPFSRLPGFSNSFFIIKCISVLNLVTGSSYSLNSLYFSLFSFWGSARLAAALGSVYPTSRKAAILAFLFFPSVVFWGSGLLKDAVMMGSMCWVVAFVLLRAHKRQTSFASVLLLLLMGYIYVRIKLFLSAVLLLVLGVYLLLMLLSYRLTVLQKPGVQIVALLVLVGLAGLAATQAVSIYHLDFIFDQIVLNYQTLLSKSLHGPHLEYPHLEPTLPSILSYAPQAFLNAVYRPFLGESGQPLYLALGLENLLLLLLTLLAAASFFKTGRAKPTLFYLALLLYILLTGAMIGLTTPNFGSLSRYRIAFLPFLAYLLLQSQYAQRILHAWERRP